MGYLAAMSVGNTATWPRSQVAKVSETPAAEMQLDDDERIDAWLQGVSLGCFCDSQGFGYAIFTICLEALDSSSEGGQMGNWQTSLMKMKG